MAQNNERQPKGWTKPELIKLGKLADVAGGSGLVDQQGGSNKS